LLRALLSGWLDPSAQDQKQHERLKKMMLLQQFGLVEANIELSERLYESCTGDILLLLHMLVLSERDGYNWVTAAVSLSNSISCFHCFGNNGSNGPGVH
jgi:uncharacterized protein YabN with tetrapyrrole methylase and pyrophosphatase domain